jgi:hypothetical protein
MHQPLASCKDGGLAVVRAVAQWVLDIKAESTNAGFPFDRPMLTLYQRCRIGLRAVESLLAHPSTDKVVNRSLRRLHRIIEIVRSEVPFERVALTLEARAKLFDKLRDVLRVEAKPKLGCENKPDPADLVQVHDALNVFELWLRANRPERGPAQNMRDAFDIILTHLDDHGSTLWGHAITLPDGTTRLVERTNMPLESMYGYSKHGERGRAGRKNLTQDLEQLPAEAFLALNLMKADYLEIVCGKKPDDLVNSLAAAFARLDAIPELRERIVAQAQCPGDESGAEIVSSSMPKADRTLVRTNEMNERVRDEARSRAPLCQPIRRKNGKSN